MRMRVLVFVVSLLAVACVGVAVVRAQAPAGSDEAAVRQAVDAYFEALKNRDIETLKKLIPAETKFHSVGRDGKIDEMSQERWHALIRPTEQSPGKYEMTGSIASLDITGNTAMVKSVVEMPRVIFQEYISMLKIDGQWRMVNKIYVMKPKPRQ